MLVSRVLMRFHDDIFFFLVKTGIGPNHSGSGLGIAQFKMVAVPKTGIRSQCPLYISRCLMQINTPISNLEQKLHNVLERIARNKPGVIHCKRQNHPYHVFQK